MKHPQARFYQSFLNSSKMNEGVVITHLPRPDCSQYLKMMDDEFIRENPELREEVLQSCMYSTSEKGHDIIEKGVKEEVCQEDKEKEKEKEKGKSTHLSINQKHKKQIHVSSTDFMNVNQPLHYEQPVSFHSNTLPSTQSIYHPIKAISTPSIQSSSKNGDSNYNNSYDNKKEGHINPSSTPATDTTVLSKLSIMKQVGDILNLK